MQNFNYLIGDPQTKECAYVDPAWEVDRLLRIAEEDGYRVTKILLTHHHFDHVEGVAEVVLKTNAEIFVHESDRPLVETGSASVTSLRQGQKFTIGNLEVTAFHTPGHTPGSVCYSVRDVETSLDHLFTGDTLFQGNCGRSDLPGGNPKTLFDSLQELKTLDPTTKIYPGHDYGTKPVSTIGYEKQNNPTLKAVTFQEFDQLP